MWNTKKNGFALTKTCFYVLLPFAGVIIFCQITDILSPLEMRIKIRSNTFGRFQSLNTSQQYTCLPRGGRMANHVFQYASIFAISMRNNLTILLQKDKDIAQYFNVPSATVIPSTTICKTFYRVDEKKCCEYDVNLTLVPSDKNYVIDGYLQSWKYFKDYFKQVKRELTFKPDILNSARFIVDNLRHSLSTRSSHYRTANVTTVGVHVRRGDMVTFREQHGGFDVASEGYIQRAIDYFLDRFDNVLFIVSSDDIPYSRTVFRYRNVTVEFIHVSSIQDMAVISTCDHVIMTVGTFGWWAGFLSGGLVVYYKYPIREGTPARQNYNYKDYFLPEWIGLE